MTTKLLTGLEFVKESKRAIEVISGLFPISSQIKYFPHWEWEAVQRAFRNGGSGLGGAAVGSA